MPAPNVYSRRWFDTFLGHIDDTIVAGETAFLRRQLLSGGRVLDLCCGPGRHAKPLTSAGYRVMGLDVDAAALREGAERAPEAAFLRADMRHMPFAAGAFDAVICMWQSFGHFDASGNASTLAAMAEVLAPNGRLVLDVYHRDFYAGRLGERVIEREGARIHERRSMAGERLRASLEYDAGGTDDFEWQLYTPTELVMLGESMGLGLVVACAEFDERVEASPAHARMQLVFSRGRR